jgi:hypothetical protein
MFLNDFSQAKHPPSTTLEKTPKLGAKSNWASVCAGEFHPGKLGTSKPGVEANKYMGLRRVFFPYVLTDGACLYPHATDPSLKRAFYAK